MDYFSPSQRRGLRSVFVSGISSPRDVRQYAMERIEDELTAKGIGIYDLIEQDHFYPEGNYSDIIRGRKPITREFLTGFPANHGISHNKIFPVRPNLRSEKYLEALAIIEGSKRQSDEAAYLALVFYTEDFAFSEGHLKHAIKTLGNFLRPDTYGDAGIEAE